MSRVCGRALLTACNTSSCSVRARGEGDRESDLDVLIVVADGDWRLRDAVSDESVEPWLTHHVLLSPVVLDAATFDRLREWGLLFYQNLEREGIDVWTRQPALS